MKHISFSTTGSFDTAILIKEAALRQSDIQTHYIDQCSVLGMDVSGCVAFSLSYDKKKPSAGHRKTYLENLLPALDKLKITSVLCCDAEYFKTLTKNKKAEPHIGYVFPCAIKGYEHIDITYGINYQQYFYNPDIAKKTHLSLTALVQHKDGQYVPLGSDVLRNVSYPETLDDIRKALGQLHQYDAITSDIEAFSLKHYDSGLGTISFSWNQHEGIAFLVDYVPCAPYEVQIWDKKDKKYKTRIAYGRQCVNREVRQLLREFLESYKGNIKWHNISYDAYILIYQLWMQDLLDQEGLLNGLDVMTRNFDCTKLITYLATNSCAGNKLSLKEQAHEFTGNYAQEDITDIRLIPVSELLEYNVVDSCATWYVYHKNYPIMLQDEQKGIYETLFKPCILDILQMQLTGMCLDMAAVIKADKDISLIRDSAVQTLINSPTVKTFTERMIAEEVITRNAEYKTKVIDASEAKFKFNPNSAPQLQKLLYEDMRLPVIDLTDTKLPATGGKTLKKVIAHTKNQEYKNILTALMDFALADKVISSFINTFKKAPMAPDGNFYLFGNFNLGGTVSGRLSSSNPNMQNIPSGSAFAKAIKKCFIAPTGWVFAGSDFNALEDVVNTLLTKDPNKVKVLVRKFDGHCFRTVYYWRDKFPHIDPDDPVSVNSIKETHATERSDSKPVSFALQYQGTWATLMTNCGFTEEEAKAIEGNFLELYQVSVQWTQRQLELASKNGYAVAAFDLRIRTPVLAQVILGNKSTPREAAAEGRTLGNAISGQSYGLLNGRASMEFMQRVRASEYRTKIRICAHIHDAIYLYMVDDFDVIKWVNDNLIECMAWNELPELQHDEIKLGSELDLFYPNWGEAITLPNKASKEVIIAACKKEAFKRKL